jgi:hypothetical protein
MIYNELVTSFNLFPMYPVISICVNWIFKLSLLKVTNNINSFLGYFLETSRLPFVLRLRRISS